MKARILSFACIVCLLLSFTLGLSSCLSIQSQGVVSAKINEQGELILIYENGKEQNLGVVIGKDGTNGTDGSTIITGENGNASLACAKGLRFLPSLLLSFFMVY